MYHHFIQCMLHSYYFRALSPTNPLAGRRSSVCCRPLTVANLLARNGLMIILRFNRRGPAANFLLWHVLCCVVRTNFKLPLDEMSQTRQRERTPMSDNPKLLVVDDEEVICLACRRIFSRQGFQVDVNTDACEGLNCALRDDYAAILLDIKMPKIDGIQFLERLRETKPDQPVLIMTGYPSIPNASAAHPPGGVGLRHQTVYAGGDHAVGAADHGRAARARRRRRRRRRPTKSIARTRDSKKSSSSTNRGSGWRSTIRRASGRCCRVCGARPSRPSACRGSAK